MPALTAKQMATNFAIDDAWCPGCGLHRHVHGEHRADCTTEPAPLMCADCDEIRLPSERGAPWQYRPATRTYHCPTHQKGTR
ncbi:hypothetical protein SEA_PINKYOSHI_48 [Mycobacterium phage PinkYoshi]|uniref:Uncharacterized protein n=3 Tax=Mycobacterium virus Halo TaxID=373407 RepID=Q1A0N0_9CAUD|nr:hypothetical protein ANGEL_48 [Mycobacterium phage Angel]YP_655566.1 hypothetical protein Halo48 [Mycobacterium phage Halo]ACB58207.1 hypothetical protein BPs1_48 [Mycobacterium phage BPs]ACU41512.1 hypothetical protein HOPE_48 [Mycobacterium phage Hope]AER48503.1 hypothetical protein AVRAFAN_48 [Mycobacterium phage Avrafan]AJK27315.1 hypothetical protein PBI_GOMASHI_47 [Mycobacterium phage Gomashi]AKY02652.1 hypothetical protein SEA_PHREAK_48 [Mycobacterium phage Phreak]ALF00740.1 hypoth